MTLLSIQYSGVLMLYAMTSSFNAVEFNYYQRAQKSSKDHICIFYIPWMWKVCRIRHCILKTKKAASTFWYLNVWF